MFFTNLGLFLLGGTIAAYWYRAIRMAAKARRRTGRGANLVPPEPLGRALRVFWAPAVVVWIAHPITSSVLRNPPGLLRPLWRPIGAAPQAVIVWAAVGVAVACLAATIACWRRMGSSWRMGIDPGEKTPLIATGPFAYVRHPIYALSAVMMTATAVAIPSPLMLAAAVVHIGLLVWESGREEQYLVRAHGRAYEEYRARVGRFVPASVTPFRPGESGSE